MIKDPKMNPRNSRRYARDSDDEGNYDYRDYGSMNTNRYGNGSADGYGNGGWNMNGYGNGGSTKDWNLQGKGYNNYHVDQPSYDYNETLEVEAWVQHVRWKEGHGLSQPVEREELERFPFRGTEKQEADEILLPRG